MSSIGVSYLTYPIYDLVTIYRYLYVTYPKYDLVTIYRYLYVTYPIYTTWLPSIGIYI